MTTLRFVGDVPLWAGLALALIVCFLSWRFYNRESFDLPRRLRWLLPLLRSAAFFLGIMILTGPVLHHRTTIGELGRVRLYLDGSRSMTMLDRHMSTGRKVLIAEQLGWLSEGHVDTTLLTAADDLLKARVNFQDQSGITQTSLSADGPSQSSSGDLSFTAEISSLGAATAELQSRLKEVSSKLPPILSDRFNKELLTPLAAISFAEGSSLETVGAQLQQVAASAESLAIAIEQEFDRTVNDMVKSGDESLQTALALFDDTPRWRRVEMGLSESSTKLLAKLRQHHDVEIIRLSGPEFSVQESLEPTIDSEMQKEPASDSEETEQTTRFSGTTDLSSGIVSTQRSRVSTESSGVSLESGETSTLESAAPKTAAVLFTDGQHNSGPSPLQTSRILGTQGVSFFSVSIGATEQAADLAVRDLEYPDLVFRKDTVRGVLIINDRAPAGRPFVAQIRYEDEILWQQQLLSQNVGDRRIEFGFKVDDLITKLGSQLESNLRQHSIPLAFEASVTPLADESEVNNNQKAFRLAAIVESYRMLILDGRPRWETRYLRNAFERDSQWSVNTIIAGPGTDEEVLRRGDENGAFPATREALFENDLIILGEISGELFSETDYEWLREFVEIRGGGILFIDGQRGELRKLAEKSVGTLLPVEWLPEVISTRPVHLQLTDRGSSESALTLAVDQQQNRKFWQELPPPNSLVAVSATAGSEVLAEAVVGDKKYPAILTRQVGAGRVLYMAFDESWRWRYKVADTWHQRIWNQLAKHVMPRPFAVSDDYVSIDTGSVRYDFGDSVDVRVRLLNLDGKPSTGGIVDALIWKDGRVVSTISLTADDAIPGIYRGRFGALPEGDYEVSVRASGYSDAVMKARSQFIVLPTESGEMTETAANESLLKQMAAASGGQFLREEDMNRLPELLAPLSNGRVVESDSLIWQSYSWFAAIIILLTVEWMLRKRAGLL